MSNINPLTNDQMFLKKISRNFGNNQDDADVSDINPLTIDQIFLKEIALSSEGAGDIPVIEETIEALSDTMAANGAHNLLPNNASSQTVDGVQYTVNSDGSITATGTATDSAVNVISVFSLPVGTYKINGCGEINNLHCTLRNNADDSFIANLTDDDYLLTVSSSSFVYKIQVQTINGTIVNKTIYPQIRLATDPSTAYTPYAMTNRELTERVVVKTYNLADGTPESFDADGLYLQTFTSDVPSASDYYVASAILIYYTFGTVYGIASIIHSASSINVRLHGKASTSFQDAVIHVLFVKK